MKIKIPVVLFFTVTMLPTEEELEQGLAARARFRNSALHDGKVEECDFVMGNVPEDYAHIPRYGENGAETDGGVGGEEVGAFFLQQVERGKWNVLDEDGNLLNEDGPLNKADARALALENTED